MLEQKEIKTVDVQIKEWFDKKNGNSYFSGIVTINFCLENEKQINLPFQYGYGDHYRDVAFQKLQKDGIIPEQKELTAYWRYYQDNNIISRHYKQENCKKSDVLQYRTISESDK